MHCDVGVEAAADVPGDVAVKRPDAGICACELHDGVAEGWEQVGVSPGGVEGRRWEGAVPVGGWAGGEDLEVEAVQVHWVRGGGVVGDD